MKQKTFSLLLPIFLLLIISISCTDTSNTSEVAKVKMPITGSWKLLSGTLVEKGDTTVTDYTKTSSFIKIINDTHFAFLQHDLQNGKDSSTASFSSGGGKYTLKDSTYTEHLEYCTAREWEGHDFSFILTLNNDTLVQRGVEKIESAGIDRLNIEKYIRIR
ncbi:MAG: hypothetical protein EOO04_29755 [Chitinophagaceae bacterium]|nr:MAG: hypothetical protein EOO04_29755 [Chitinophagaceae bacterium]